MKHLKHLKLVKKNKSQNEKSFNKIRDRLISLHIHMYNEKSYSIDDELSIHKEAIKTLIDYLLLIGFDKESVKEFTDYYLDTQNSKNLIDKELFEKE